MPIPSKYPDKKCSRCGVMIKKGDMINKIDATGKWCSNSNCPNPPAGQAVQQTTAAPKKEAVNPNVKVTSPFDEAELIARWAGNKAYKIVMADVDDFSKLTQQEKSGLGQKEGMYTRLLADIVLDLMKQHNIKTNYGADAFD